VIADHYYGDTAVNYDAERSAKPGWLLEQRAISDFVKEGPVLDVPCGTGRFFDIYQRKRLDYIGIDLSPDMIQQAMRNHPTASVMTGSVFKLPFADRAMQTVVCMRLLVWLDEAAMTTAVAELRRVTNRTLVINIRIGKAGVRCKRGSITHSMLAFAGALSGMKVEERRITAITEAGTFVMFRCAAPSSE
jgi:ubiquinone/menaquinone biosynthesis C-methylase UbiE